MEVYSSISWQACTPVLEARSTAWVETYMLSCLKGEELENNNSSLLVASSLFILYPHKKQPVFLLLIGWKQPDLAWRRGSERQLK